MEPFEAVSPLDARYIAPDPAMQERVAPYLSEAASIRYQLRVEVALLEALAGLGICDASVPEAASKAAEEITAREVFDEERRIGHNIRALVNCLRGRLDESARGFVHLFATSNDILDTTRALAYREFASEVLIPDLLALVGDLTAKARATAALRQIGRTHGQHAEPITYGYFLATVVSRLGTCVEGIERARASIRGKFSGAVGAHSTYSLHDPEDPGALERAVLERLDLRPSDTQISTQCVEPEAVADLCFWSLLALGAIADLADDLRHLARTEIAEVSIGKAGGTQVGSSTMPHKVNPVAFENIKSIWKAFVPRLTSVMMDGLSEHQRDLTNSASGRFHNEILAGVDYAVVRMRRAMAKVEPNEEGLRKNLEASRAHTVAEPLYVILALGGHPDGYDAVRALIRRTQEEGISLLETARSNPATAPILEKAPPHQIAVLDDPTSYTGDAEDRTRLTCDTWEKRLAPLRARASRT